MKLPPEGCRDAALAAPAAAGGAAAACWLGLLPGSICCCCCCLGVAEGSRQPVKGHSRQLLLAELWGEKWRDDKEVV